MKALDLFSGIGGFALGFERAGIETMAFCEIDPFCRKVLKKHWPDVPCFEDITKLKGTDLNERPDIICGGFPCQDISVAGRGVGIGGSRSGLWREMLRLIAELHPSWVLIENVPNLRTKGADEVLAGLEAEGYACWATVVGAWAVGASHNRERVWILGYSGGSRSRNIGSTDSGQGWTAADAPESKTVRPLYGTHGAGWTSAAGGFSGADVAHSRLPRLEGERLGASSTGAELALSASGDRNVGNATSTGREECLVADRPTDAAQGGTGLEYQSERTGTRFPAFRGQPQFDWEQPRRVEREVGRTDDGISLRLVRRNQLKALGNSVVPQIPKLFGRFIMELSQ